MGDDLKAPAAPAAGGALDRAEHLSQLYLRLGRTLQQNVLLRVVAGVILLGLVLAFSLGLLLAPLVFGVDKESLKGFGLPGVFLANFLSTATVFVPVPGLTAAGQALILQQGDLHFPLLVGILGGLGMALGEVTAYLAGLAGGEAARGREVPGPEWVRRLAGRIARGTNWLMAHYGFATLLVLAAVPNPAFEFAGITAGAVRFPFPRFMVAVTVGKVIRGIILAYLGDFGVDLLGL